MISRNSKTFPTIYFITVLLLTVPFLILSSFIDLSEKIPIDLPISALGFICPTIAVSILNRNSKYVKFELNLKEIFNIGKIKSPFWHIISFGLLPVLMFATFQTMKMFQIPLPNALFNLIDILIFFILFFVAAIGEEIGWTKFLTPIMARQNGIILTGIYIGVFWAVVHIMPYFQTQRTTTWIFWQCNTTILLRIIMVWLFYRCGQSLFAIIIFHTMINMSEFFFPKMGSHYDPLYFTVILLITCVIIFLLEKNKIKIIDNKIKSQPLTMYMKS